MIRPLRQGVVRVVILGFVVVDLVVEQLKRPIIHALAFHIPRSLNACGAFFGPVISTVNITGTDRTE